jgi:hypothetical protein
MKRLVQIGMDLMLQEMSSVCLERAAMHAGIPGIRVG